jgi:hypothetical protein
MGVGVVPDGAAEDGRRDGRLPESGSVEAQVAVEIALGQVRELFGADAASGGGAGGEFVFADLAELDGVIAAWREELDAIAADRDLIDDTRRAVDHPAADVMSVYHTQTTRQSLDALRAHNQELFAYAESYLKKLVETRQQMQNDDDAAATSMRTVYPA